MHGDIFYPTFLLRMDPAHRRRDDVGVHRFTCSSAGFFTFLFLRAWGFRFYGALVGGLAYMLSGSIAAMRRRARRQAVRRARCCRLALLLVTRGMRDGRRGRGVGSRSPSASPSCRRIRSCCSTFCSSCGAFALYLAFADASGARQATAQRRGQAAWPCAPGGVRHRHVDRRRSVLAGVRRVQAVVAARRRHDRPRPRATRFPSRKRSTAYWPQFSGILDNYWGRNFIPLSQRLLRRRRPDSRRRRVRPVREQVVPPILGRHRRRGAAVGLRRLHAVLPPDHAIVPGTIYFRAPSTIIYVTAFAVSVLAAIGMERVLARRVSPKYAIGCVIAGLAFAVLMSVGGYTRCRTR